MHSTILVTCLGLLAALCWGSADFFAARAAKTVGPIQSVLVSSILELPIFIIIYLLFHTQWIFNDAAFMYAVAAGGSFALAGIFFFKGLEKGPVSLVSPIGSMYPLSTTVVALLIFKAHLSGMELAGIILTLLGIMTTAGLLNVKKSERKITIGPKFALLTALFWGLAFAMLAQAIKRIGWLNAGMIEITSIAIIMLVALRFIKGSEKITLKSATTSLFNKYICLNVTINIVGISAINIGISRSIISGGAVVTAISACYPIITIILALKHFDENISRIKLSGVFVGIAGIVLLSL